MTPSIRLPETCEKRKCEKESHSFMQGRVKRDESYLTSNKSEPDLTIEAAEERVPDLIWADIFDSLDTLGEKRVFPQDILLALSKAGLQRSDPRLQAFCANLQRHQTLTKSAFMHLCSSTSSSSSIIQRALQASLIIPDFHTFTSEVERLYQKVKIEGKGEGEVASYIPQLAEVDPEAFGISICTIDGQCFSRGDSLSPFSVQSCSKPISYLMALAQHGRDKVHRYVGREPSGTSFNAIGLDSQNRPHNPMINSGAILCSALVHPEEEADIRMGRVLDVWKRLCGKNLREEEESECQAGNRRSIVLNTAVYASEKATADRNYALAYFMREKKVFPPNTDLHATLDFYFRCCSVDITCEDLAVASATLANAGICPLTQDRVFSGEDVKDTLSLLHSCGMYDFSGEFAFLVGLPAKSGVSGVVLVVIPNLMGIAIWSPRLDLCGNSVRGVGFCRELVKIFNFHVYDSLIAHQSRKVDPRHSFADLTAQGPLQLCWAASKGDLREVQRLVASGVSVTEADYDGRTPLHLAAAEGHVPIIRFLLNRGADPTVKDRWGGTPLDDARTRSRAVAGTLLEQALNANALE